MKKIEKLNSINMIHIKDSTITDIDFVRDGCTSKLILSNEKGYRLHCSSALEGFFVNNVFILEYPE